MDAENGMGYKIILDVLQHGRLIKYKITSGPYESRISATLEHFDRVYTYIVRSYQGRVEETVYDVNASQVYSYNHSQEPLIKQFGLLPPHGESSNNQDIVH